MGEYFKAKSSMRHLVSGHIYKLVGFIYSSAGDSNEKTISEAGIFIDMNDPACRERHISFKNFDNFEKIYVEFKKGMMVKLKRDFINIDNNYIRVRKNNIFSIKEFKNDKALLANESIEFMVEGNNLENYFDPVFNKSI